MMRRYVRAAWVVLALYGASVARGQTGYVVRTVAGSDFVGDGGAAVSALLFAPECLAMDAAGNLYIADPADHRVRKVSASGVITTVAGDGQAGFAGDGGPASQARLNRPYGLAVDAAGNLYIADFGNARVRKVGFDGVIRTLAGGGVVEPSASGGRASAVRLLGPRNLALDRSGNLYVADFLDHRVYRVTPNGDIRVVAGTGAPGLAGNGGPAEHAQLNFPAGLALDSAGELYIADSGNRRVRRLSGGMLHTLNVPVTLELPTGLTFDVAGNLYVADNARIVKLTPAGAASLIAVAAREVVVDRTGNLYVASGSPQVLRVAPTGAISLLAGGTREPSFWGDGGPAAMARLNSPRGLAIGPDGALWIADSGNARVRRVSSAGVITTAAGAGRGGVTGENIAALSARLWTPVAVALDAAGNLWLADAGVSRIRRVSPDGWITTVAGTGQAGFNEDGTAMFCQLNLPSGLAVDAAGNVYIADTDNHRVRKLTPGGALITIAGRGVRGYAGDGGPAAEAWLDSPAGLAVDAEGNLYIADRMNHAIRKVSRQGFMSTVAGNGTAGAGGDGGPAVRAQLNRPAGVAVDRQGNIYVADTENHRIRKVTADGIIRTIAGDGQPGFSGDGGPASEARLRWPAAITVDGEGNVYVADQDNHRIRLLAPVVEPAAAALEQATVVNAASLLPGPVAPGQIVSIFGSGIGPQSAEGPKLVEGRLESILGEVELLWDGKPGPLLYVSRDQINAQVPYAVASVKETQVEVRYKGSLRAKMVLPVAEAVPALFTVSGGGTQAAALNEDGTLNSPANPAPRGSVVTLFATGEGQTDPPGEDGRPAGVPLPKPRLPLSLIIGVHPAEILFAGSAPGLVGVLQINARVPGGFLPAGQLPIELRIGDARSPAGVTLAVR